MRRPDGADLGAKMLLPTPFQSGNHPLYGSRFAADKVSAVRKAPRPRHLLHLDKFEAIFAVLLLSILMAIPFIVGDQPCCGEDALNPLHELMNSSASGDAKKQIILLVLYSSCLPFLYRRRTIIVSSLGLPLLGLLGWCLASMLWSLDPSVSFRRWVALAGTVALGSYLGSRFNFDAMLRLMLSVIAIVLTASFVVAVLFPMNGLDYDGRLRGVFDHKNDLGEFAAIALLIVLAILCNRERRRPLVLALHWLLAAAALLALLLAHSASPLPVLGLSLPVLALCRAVRKPDSGLASWTPLLLAAALSGLLLLATDVDLLAQLLGRDSDLSGRIKVWDFALDMIGERPLSGYGYGAFWTGDESPGAVFWRSTYLAAPHAHNGFLELLLDAGAVGLAMLLAALAVSLCRLLSLLRVSGNQIPWAVSYLVFLVGTQITEPGIWTGNALQTVLFVYVVVQTSGAKRQAARKQRRSRPIAPVRLSVTAG